MAVLSSVLNALSCFHPQLLDITDDNSFQEAVARIMAKVRTIAAFSYRHALGYNITYPHPDKKYSANFLHMMFSDPYKDYDPDPVIVRALDTILLLHADHEQNCSTSEVVRRTCSHQWQRASLRCGGRCTVAPTWLWLICLIACSPKVCQ